jgi:hypothetical protein
MTLYPNTDELAPGMTERYALRFPGGELSAPGQPPECVAGPPRQRGPAASLDQERENRENSAQTTHSGGMHPLGATGETGCTPSPRFLVDQMGEGELVLLPQRSGGSFDPMGVRAVDVYRADDVAALVAALAGRWLMITLTIDRRLFTCPEAAYQRCNERVREVARAVSLRGVHFTALELQMKTGDGWPHWHMMVWAPDDRSLAEIERAVRRAWTITTPHVDLDTGEETFSREAIGAQIDVQESRDRVGAGIYMAKYVLKQWLAHPGWMLQSNRQLRKLRLSRGAFEVLESLHRHVPHRGGRAVASHRRRPARALCERLAWSGAEHVVVKREGGKLRFVGTVPVPATPEGWGVLMRSGAVPLQLGEARKVRFRITGSDLRRLRAASHRLEPIRDRELERRRWRLRNAWRFMQIGIEVEDVRAPGDVLSPVVIDLGEVLVTP